MKTYLKNLLNELLEELIRNQSHIVHLLQPGLNSKQIDEKIIDLPIDLPKEVYALYKWRNGINWSDKYSLGEMWIFPLGIFTSIERSIENYKYYQNTNDKFWNESLFMLFEGGGGEMFFIDCNENSISYRMIIMLDYGAVDHEILITIYDSLNKLIETIVECYKEKIFWFEDTDPNYDLQRPLKILNRDSRREIIKSRDKNPNAELWKIFDADKLKNTI